MAAALAAKRKVEEDMARQTGEEADSDYVPEEGPDGAPTSEEETPHEDELATEGQVGSKRKLQRAKKNTYCLTEEQEALAFQMLEHFPFICLLYTSPSPRDKRQSRMPSSA